MDIPWQKILPHGGRAFIGGGACVPFALIDDFKDVELCHVHTAGDPLADLMMTSKGFGELTKLVRAYADEFCEGRVVSVLEGGYDVESLATCVKAHLRGME